MKELLFAVMSVSLSAAIISILCPENEGIKKQISFVCALSICASLSLPIIKLISGREIAFDFAPSKEDKKESTEAAMAIIDLAINNLCREMEALAESRYGIKNADLTLVTDTSSIQSVKISSGTLYGEGNLSEAAEYIGKELGCEIGYEEQ